MSKFLLLFASSCVGYAVCASSIDESFPVDWILLSQWFTDSTVRFTSAYPVSGSILFRRQDILSRNRHLGELFMKIQKMRESYRVEVPASYSLVMYNTLRLVEKYAMACDSSKTASVVYNRIPRQRILTKALARKRKVSADVLVREWSDPLHQHLVRLAGRHEIRPFSVLYIYDKLELAPAGTDSQIPKRILVDQAMIEVMRGGADGELFAELQNVSTAMNKFDWTDLSHFQLQFLQRINALFAQWHHIALHDSRFGVVTAPRIRSLLRALPTPVSSPM